MNRNGLLVYAFADLVLDEDEYDINIDEPEIEHNYEFTSRKDINDVKKDDYLCVI